MRQKCLDMVYELAQRDKRIFFIGSDLGYRTLQEFKENIPERFLMEGVSEANLIGMGCGLAMEGKIVYVNTIATFLTRRCFEQVVLDACLHNVNIRLIANGVGLVYAPLGPTHLAIDDIAILRTIPNMTIIAVADAQEMTRMMPATVDYPGPIYIRLAKGHDPIVTTDDEPFVIGKAYVTREGDDALIITTGITLGIAQKAADALSARGTETAIIHVPTVKPLDRDTILTYCRKISNIVVIEEGLINGGLGSAVAELIAEANFESPKSFKRIGIPDVFPDIYGSQEDQLKYFDITADNLIASITQAQRILGKAVV